MDMLFAVVLLVVGIALLLMNIGVISLEIKEFFVMFFPILFIIIGMMYLFKSIRNRSSSSFFLSLFWLPYGVLLILGQQEMISFSYGDWWKLWPILLIYLAMDKLLFKGRKRMTVKYESDDHNVRVYNIDLKNIEKNIGKNIKKNFSTSDVHFNEQNWPLKPMDIHTTIGDFYFDFSKAFIPDEETKVRIKSRIGDVKMLIPEEIPIKIEAKTKVGDIRLFDIDSSETKQNIYFESPNYEEEEKKIDITIEIGIGSIRIDRV
ncbi:hypothetical protein BLX88_17185 [Bacillus obstructivus]|uniref:Cell wall-active antibiotics response LiaF-like C-terminal domain-containing protein n=2 Tax=Heyndrickxia oleronia TaxID=38875 RepID=A0A8E2IB11_9BACI|nr:hypothetical protein BLX88_17185 [Bacillus obstructivus]OOP69567.1 hypothetical protein BWZ43_04535 [Heyndrickxia oleronia]